ncbi:MAG: hypothetical protein AAF598_19795 [Bacteroidota bacterium]
MADPTYASISEYPFEPFYIGYKERIDKYAWSLFATDNTLLAHIKLPSTLNKQVVVLNSLGRFHTEIRRNRIQLFLNYNLQTTTTNIKEDFRLVYDDQMLLFDKVGKSPNLKLRLGTRGSGYTPVAKVETYPNQPFIEHYAILDPTAPEKFQWFSILCLFACLNKQLEDRPLR